MWIKIGLRIQDPPFTLTLFAYRLSANTFVLAIEETLYHNLCHLFLILL